MDGSIDRLRARMTLFWLEFLGLAEVDAATLFHGIVGSLSADFDVRELDHFR
jgi:hypothetical protein